MESIGMQKRIGRVAPRLRSEAVKLAKRFGITDLDQFLEELVDAWAGYELHSALVENPETLTQAKADLKKVASLLRALAEQLEVLGPTTMSLLFAFARNMEPSRCLALPAPRLRDLSPEWTDFNDSHPRAWVPCLIELESLCVNTEGMVSRFGSKRGRGTFTSKIAGTPDEVLAEECESIAARHGRLTKADVLRIMQAVKRAGSRCRTLKEEGRSTVRRRFKFGEVRGKLDHG